MQRMFVAMCRRALSGEECAPGGFMGNHEGLMA